MKYARALAFAALAGITIISTGCAVTRDQQTVGARRHGVTAGSSAWRLQLGRERQAVLAGALDQ